MKVLQAFLKREHGVGVVRVFDDAVYAVSVLIQSIQWSYSDHTIVLLQHLEASRSCDMKETVMKGFLILIFDYLTPSIYYLRSTTFLSYQVTALIPKSAPLQHRKTFQDPKPSLSWNE